LEEAAMDAYGNEAVKDVGGEDRIERPGEIEEDSRHHVSFLEGSRVPECSKGVRRGAAPPESVGRKIRGYWIRGNERNGGCEVNVM
jgi:hypothetical protein